MTGRPDGVSGRGLRIIGGRLIALICLARRRMVPVAEHAQVRSVEGGQQVCLNIKLDKRLDAGAIRVNLRPVRCEG